MPETFVAPHVPWRLGYETWGFYWPWPEAPKCPAGRPWPGPGPQGLLSAADLALALLAWQLLPTHNWSGVVPVSGWPLVSGQEPQWCCSHACACPCTIDLDHWPTGRHLGLASAYSFPHSSTLPSWGCTWPWFASIGPVPTLTCVPGLSPGLPHCHGCSMGMLSSGARHKRNKKCLNIEGAVDISLTTQPEDQRFLDLSFKDGSPDHPAYLNLTLYLD